MSRRLLSVLLALLSMVTSGSVEGRGLQGEVVTWSDFSYVQSVASSMTHVYFATTAGILRYDKLRSQWGDPMTGSLGIDHRDIRLVLVNEFDDQLFAETSTGLYEYDELFDRWFLTQDRPRFEHRQSHLRPPLTMHAPLGHTYANDGRIIDGLGRVFPLHDVLDDGSGQLWIGTWGYGPASAGEA